MKKVRMIDLSFDGVNIVSYPYEWYLKLLHDHCYFMVVGQHYIYNEDVEDEESIC